MSKITPSSFKRVFVGSDDLYATRVPAEDLFHVAGAYGPIFRVSSTASVDTLLLGAGSANYITVTGAAAGSSPVIAAAGSDANIPINLLAKGNRGVKIGSSVDFLSPIFTANSAMLNALSNRGGVGILGGSRTSDLAQAGASSARGVDGWVFNDNTTYVQGAWGGYIETRRSANTGTTIGIEINVLNSGSPVVNYPGQFGLTGITPALWLSSGRTDVPSGTDNTLAIGIANNGNRFQTGLMFQVNSIVANSALGGQQKAIAFGAYHALVWHEPADSITSQISCNIITPGLGQRILFTDSALELQNFSGDRIARFEAPSSGVVNYPTFVPNTTGNGVAIVARGEGNVSMSVYSNGTAGVALGTDGGATPQVVVDHTASATRNIRLTGATVSGNPSIGTNAGDLALTPATGITRAATLIIAGTAIISTSSTPASATATGAAGTIAWDSNYIYIATAANTWKRVAVATW